MPWKNTTLSSISFGTPFFEAMGGGRGPNRTIIPQRVRGPINETFRPSRESSCPSEQGIGQWLPEKVTPQCSLDFRTGILSYQSSLSLS